MKVSIITATYESSKTISNCIVSVNAQCYPKIEHIVIDGNSKDDTVKIINNQLNRVYLMVSEPDKMVYDALNKGIRYATGNVIGVLHSDDMFGSEHTISNIVETFEKTEADVVYGDLVFVHRLDTTKVLRYWKSSPFSSRKLNFGWMPPHPTVFIRREVFEKYGCFDLSFCISSDYDFLLRVFKDSSLKFVYMPELITIMRIGGISTGTFKNSIRKSKQDYLVLKKNNIQFPLIAVLLKIISKIPQLTKRSTSLLKINNKELSETTLHFNPSHAKYLVLHENIAK
ncbi:MAG: glycosyltransferase family 2 protein [Bacteroidia bacterium]|nr:glycosyltransferase family 2 protein [Bacteroidia bacterium]